jgi:hypothetical protein
MAIRLSTGFRNGFAQGYGLKELLRDGRLYVYSGTQPLSADLVSTGTLLCSFTLSGGSFTTPVRAKAELTIAGVAGSVDSVKLGGMDYNLLASAVANTGTATGTATAVAAAINARENPFNVWADTNGADVLRLWLPYWLGANGNSLTFAATATTTTITASGTFGSGTTAVNGLNFQFPAVDGVLSKEVTVWQGTASAAGTAGWFRFIAGGAGDPSAASTTDVRFDGSVGTSGADLTISSAAISLSSIQTISAFTLTIPAS